MSKKHYETVARVLRVNRKYSEVSPDAAAVIDDIARDLSIAFASDNDRFDRARFLAACEVDT
jgi:hypothetical protein